MISKIWSGENKIYWLLFPLSLIYGGIVYIRKWLYRLGIFKSWRSPVPIIIVGNISVGGTGKTPTVILLVQHLQQKGFNVGVVSRGYGGKSKHYPFLVNETTSTAQAGDEPVLIYRRTHVPLAISPKRSDAVKQLINEHNVDVVITDDGLQHYGLQRDIEIVIIDGKRGFGNGCLLPAGPMREPKSRLNCVDFIIINSNNEQKFTDLTTYNMTLKSGYAVNLVNGERRNLQEFSGHIHAIAGIGDPNRFFTMLMQLGINISKQTPFADHCAFSLPLLKQYISDDETVFMTEKDAVKCLSFASEHWWYVPIDATLPNPFFTALEDKIKTLNQ